MKFEVLKVIQKINSAKILPFYFTLISLSIICSPSNSDTLSNSSTQSIAGTQGAQIFMFKPQLSLPQQTGTHFGSLSKLLSSQMPESLVK